MTGWIIALISIVIAFLGIAVFLLPRLILHTRYAVSAPSDRGIKESDASNEQNVLFEPEPATRRFISRYVLSNRDGKRVLVCKLGKNISYIDYDVVVFGAGGKVKAVFNVKENPADGGYTRVVELPSDTENVSLYVNEADGEKFTHNIVKRTTAKSIAVYAVCSAVLIALAVVGIKVCCAYIFGGLFAESFLSLERSTWATVAIAAVTVAIYSVVAVVTFVLYNKRKGGFK